MSDVLGSLRGRRVLNNHRLTANDAVEIVFDSHLVADAVDVEDVLVVASASESHDFRAGPDALKAVSAVEEFALLEKERAVRQLADLLSDPVVLAQLGLTQADEGHDEHGDQQVDRHDQHEQMEQDSKDVAEARL